MILPRFIRNRRSEIRAIEKAVPGVKATQDVTWNTVTTLGAGSGCFTLVEFQTRDQGLQLVRFIREKLKKKIYVLGGGTNIVGSDGNISDTIFIRPGRGNEFAALSYRPESCESNVITAGCAVSLKNIADYSCTFGLGGISGLYGIPGTLGGAIKMNAGANGMAIGDFICEIELLDLENAVISRINPSASDWEYRKGPIPENSMVLFAGINLVKVDTQNEKQLLKQEIARRLRMPSGRSAGCVFKNPSPTLSAGMLLERSGAKNFKSGAFAVSARHANWIVREPSSSIASEKDFLDVFTAMKESVYRKTGIILKQEVRFVNMDSMKSTEREFKRLNIVLLKGGVSSEREISLLSGANVAKALREAGHNVTEYDIKELEITQAMRECDVVYPILHGGFGEDGRIQKLLEDASIKFVGSSSEACRIIMDKRLSKELMIKNGVGTPGYKIVNDANEPLPADIPLPLIVKPNAEGSTIGLSLVTTPDEWKNALEQALKFDKNVLVEEYIDGVETTISIVLGQVLPIVELEFPGKLLDYDAKYIHKSGETLYHCPPRHVSEEVQKIAREQALKFAEAAGASTLVRVDVLVRRSDNAIFVLEGNSMPGCTDSSFMPRAARAAGMDVPELCSRLALAAFYGK